MNGCDRPLGAYHNVVRWVNRSSFSIRPPPARVAGKAYTRAQRPHSSAYQNQTHKMHAQALQKSNSHSHVQAYANAPGAGTVAGAGRLAIPGTDGLFVDPGWYGTVVVEAEGTNEGLADLQERCGPGVFPPRIVAGSGAGSGNGEAKRVFRILRERRWVFRCFVLVVLTVRGYQSTWRDLD